MPQYETLFDLKITKTEKSCFIEVRQKTTPAPARGKKNKY